jgi:exosortase
VNLSGSLPQQVVLPARRAAGIGWLLLLLGLTGWLYRNELWVLFASWFDDGDYITKGPILWGLAGYFLLRDAASHRLFGSRGNTGDLLLVVVVLLLLVLLDKRLPLLLPMLVIALIRHFSAERSVQPNGFILFCLLAFSLPYFPLLVPYLQSMAVFVVEGTLGLFGIPVLVQENYIAIPRGQFYVADSCSGFRYLANNLILFFLYALFSRFNTRQFLMALVVTVILALIVNWLRIFIIIFVAHNWGLDVPFFVKDHGNLGWVVYIFMLIPFFYAFLRIERMRLGRPKRLQFLNREWLPFTAQWLLLPVFAWSLLR